MAGLPDGPLGVAISGGGDSTALLHLLQETFPAADMRAVTVDHGLRAESAAEAVQVAAHCARLGVAHETLHWTGWDGRGNVAAAAREARYGLIAGWARANQVAAVLLAHTADDVAETFLMRLGRSAGVDGLAAMAARFRRGGVCFARPLLEVGRADLRAYLSRHHIDWTDDPSNDDMTRERPRIRAALEVLAGLGIPPGTIAHSARALESARAALEHYAEAEVARRVTEDRGDLLLDGAGLPAEMVRRLRLAGLAWIGGEGYPPRQSALDAMDEGLAVAGRHTLSGCVVMQQTGHLRITREANAVRNLATTTTAIWDRRWQLEGPHAPGLEVRALGEGLRDCPDWRQTGLPRASLAAGPAVWRGQALIAAPLAGFGTGWSARIVAPFRIGRLVH
ncbi:MAG: tRNA lysidine(34) synthetase TilS [Limimaricola sp.]|nr:tRNA lysidine(34) synthetase TilS [Limimaricola sp.]